MLEQLAPDLNGPDLHLLPMAITRPACRAAAQLGHQSFVARQKNIMQLRITHVPRLRRSAEGSARAVLSEEDILGCTQHQLEDQFYPKLSGVDLLNMLSKSEPLKVYLSGRSFDTQLSSAYFEALKMFPDTPQRLQHGIQSVLDGTSNWIRLIDRVAAHLPQAEIAFWRQEDYAAEAQHIVPHVLGTTLASLPNIPRPRQTASPNANAMVEVDKLDPSMDRRQRHRTVERIYAKHPKGEGPEPNLLTEAQRDALQAAYARDIAQMRERYTDLGELA